jgi:hypothetical protein
MCFKTLGMNCGPSPENLGLRAACRARSHMVWGDDMTRPFCPHGYLTSQEAIGRAALHWFPEEIAALDAAAARERAIPDKLNSDNQKPTSVEALARALSSQLSISEILRQQIEDVLIKTEHRLRSFLHQGVATAYYFGGLFGQGRQAVAHEFWATPEIEGQLISGTIWPFGKPSSFFEKRPNYQLFLLETDLKALLSADPKSPLPGADFTEEASRSEFEHLDPAITGRIQNPETADIVVDDDMVASQPKRHKSRPAFERARRAVEATYPDGVPDAATESNKKLCKRVREKLSEAVSDDTILRAVGRRK